MPTPNMLSGFSNLGVSTSGGGRTAYGTVPNPIATPPNIYSQLQSVPGFSANTSGAGSVIQSQLAGQVSPQTLNALKTGAAQFGVSSGMPGSGLEQNQLFGNIAGFSEGQQQKGVSNYLAEAGTLGPQMTNPNLAAEISAHNADLAAAPDPKLAAKQAFQDWLRGFQYTRGAGGSYNGGPGSWGGGVTIGGPSGFSTSHSNWGGFGGSPPVFSTPDAFGYNYTNPEAGTTAVLGAINPTTPYTGSSGFSNPYFYTGDQSGGYADPSYGDFVGYTGG